MRHFTNSNTFDVNFLFNAPHNNEVREKHEAHKFNNEAMFDVKVLFEK